MLNLTQHSATPSQHAAGVIDLPPPAQAALRELLTFHSLPTWTDIEERAQLIAELAKQSTSSNVMIGGAPYLMAPLARHLAYAGFHVHFAFSRREVTEQSQLDGTVRKISTFIHEGFIHQTGI